MNNYLWFLIGTGAWLGLPFLSLVLLNHYSTAEDAAMYAFSYAVTAPLHAAFSVGVRYFIAIDRLHGFSIEDALAQRVHLCLAMILGAASVAVLSGSTPTELVALLGMGLFRGAEGLVEISAGILQRRNRGNLIACVYTSRLIVCGTVFFLGITFGWSLGLNLLFCSLAHIALFHIADLPLLKTADLAPSLSDTLKSLASTRPFRLFLALFPVSILGIVLVFELNLPRLLVKELSLPTALAVYTTLGLLFNAIVNLPAQVFSMTFAPLGLAVRDRVMPKLVEAKRILWINLFISIGFGVMIVLSSYLIDVAWLSIFTAGLDPKLTEELFPVLAWGSAFGVLQSYGTFHLMALGAIHIQTICLVLKIAILLAWIAIAPGGVLGIATAYTAATAVSAILHALAIFRTFSKLQSDLHLTRPSV